MRIRKKELVRINGQFGGKLVYDDSLDHALRIQNNKILGPFSKLACLWRAILVHRPFSDGNKRTAVYAAIQFAAELGRQADKALLFEHANTISQEHIPDIRRITLMLRAAIR